MKKLCIEKMNLQDEKDIQFLEGFLGWTFFQTSDIRNEEEFLRNIDSLIDQLHATALLVDSSSNVYWIIVVNDFFLEEQKHYIKKSK